MTKQSDARHEVDALGRVASFQHTLQLPVLGIPVRFETNDTRVLALADHAFGRWRELRPDAPMPAPHECRICITVEPGEESGEHARVRYRVGDDGFVLLTTAASAGYADPLRRESRAWVTQNLVRDAEHFRYGVLEALTIALLSRLDRQPVHAAAIVQDGAALLLAGPSGVGKSTLAYTAAGAGFGVLAEDVVYVQRSPHLRMWGGSPFLHLSPEAAGLFPELDGVGSVQLANGKRKIVVDLRRLGAPIPLFVDRAAVCLLRRTTAAASPALRPLRPEEVTAALGARLEPGFDLFADTIAAAYEDLAAGGGWELSIGGPPAGHVPLLRSMLEELARRP